MEYKIMGTYDGKHNETQLIDKNGEKNNLKSKNNDENIWWENNSNDVHLKTHCW